MCSPDCFLAILAVLFPPVAVWVKSGICSADSIINLALLCLGYIPGLLHAWYIIAKHPDPYSNNYEAVEGGNQQVYYYTATYPSVTSHTQPQYLPPQQPSNQPVTRPQQYGTTASSSPATETVATGEAPKSITPQSPLVVVDGMSHETLGSSAAGPSVAPPSYSDVVKGDFKVQHD